jgi:hypothetical protein
MLSTVLLVIAAVLFIVTFGIHSFILASSPIDRPMYTRHPVISLIPAISGFILSTICWVFVLGWHWLLVFFSNIVLVFLIGPWLTKAILVRFSGGKGLGNDMLYVFLGGLVAFIIGLVTFKAKVDSSDSSFHKDANYKYEYRTGNSGNYSYNYDVLGIDEDGNAVGGNAEMNGKYGEGTITNDDGDELSADFEWIGSGQLEATDENGKTYDFQVE